MSKSYQKKYRDNMTDEQKQRYRDKQRIDDTKKNIEII